MKVFKVKMDASLVQEVSIAHHQQQERIPMNLVLLGSTARVELLLLSLMAMILTLVRT